MRSNHVSTPVSVDASSSGESFGAGSAATTPGFASAQSAVGLTSHTGFGVLATTLASALSAVDSRGGSKRNGVKAMIVVTSVIGIGGLAAYLSLQNSRRLEHHHAARRYRHLSAGLRITADALAFLAHHKRAERRQFHRLTFFQAIGDLFQNQFHWPQEHLKRAHRAMLDCRSNDLLTLARAALQAAIRNEADLLALLPAVPAGSTARYSLEMRGQLGPH
jgi:hypothetical protein